MTKKQKVLKVSGHKTEGRIKNYRQGDGEWQTYQENFEIARIQVAYSRLKK